MDGIETRGIVTYQHPDRSLGRQSSQPPRHVVSRDPIISSTKSQIRQFAEIEFSAKEIRTRTNAPFSSGFGNLTVLKSGSGTLDWSSTTAKCLSAENPNDSIARRAKGSPTPCIAVYVNSRDDCEFILGSRVVSEHSANRDRGRRRQDVLFST